MKAVARITILHYSAIPRVSMAVQSETLEIGPLPRPVALYVAHCTASGSEVSSIVVPSLIPPRPTFPVMSRKK